MLSGKIESVITCKTSQGHAIKTMVQQLNPHQVVFEVHDPRCILRTSEVLEDFQLKQGERTIYAGRAVVTNLIKNGAGFICEAALDGISLEMPELTPEAGPVLKNAFTEFLANWGKNYRIHPEFKILIADMNSYLSDLRLWLEHVELGLKAVPPEERARIEQHVLVTLQESTVASLNALFEKFEAVADQIRPEDRPAHRTWARRQIHPLLLSAPFADRTYHKPLGYAGDYEMVNMILRDPYEGGSLFAKALNGWFLSQPPAEAHRNRIKYLTNQLIHETARASAAGRKARVFNLGCGPAVEVQRFLAESDLCNHAELTLLDFNDETLAYTTKQLTRLKELHSRSTQINMIKKSVVQIVTGRGKLPVADAGNGFDFVYCAGLFDYLPDHFCQQLMDIFYSMLAPGGLLVATNVDAVNPIQQMLDYMLDWVLIYRSGKQLGSVAPKLADPDRVSVHADVTSVNIFVEVRKPAL